MSFESLNLHEALVAAVRDAGYTEATEVQQRAIPPALEGRDLMVSSSTGSGKTASFVLPALTRVLAARNDAAQRRVPTMRRPAGRRGARSTARACWCWCRRANSRSRSRRPR